MVKHVSAWIRIEIAKEKNKNKNKSSYLSLDSSELRLLNKLVCFHSGWVPRKPCAEHILVLTVLRTTAVINHPLLWWMEKSLSESKHFCFIHCLLTAILSQCAPLLPQEVYLCRSRATFPSQKRKEGFVVFILIWENAHIWHRYISSFSKHISRSTDGECQSEDLNIS